MRNFFYFTFALTVMLMCNCKPDADALPHGTRNDADAFPIRLVHLDVSRHFFPPEAIKTLIDELQRLDFNYLHLHLVDDQGWRLPVPGYEKLTVEGARRIEPDGTLYAPVFTVAELKDLVAYAAERGITILPEVDVPGHSRALLAAYPQLSCAGVPQQVSNNVPPPRGEVRCSTLCVSNPETLKLMYAVIDQLCEIFPSPYIHMGGDECDFSPWKSCPKCQAHYRELGVNHERELQADFMNKLGAYLAKKGRTMVVWDEYADAQTPPCSPKPVVMVWQNFDRLPGILEKGYNCILAPANYTYLDYAQGVPGCEPSGDHVRTLSSVYSMPGCTDSRVIGLGGCLWAEEVATVDRMQYMYFPRLFALAEMARYRDAEKRLPWDEFRVRAAAMLQSYRARGINAAVSGFQCLPVAKGGVHNGAYTLVSELPLQDDAVIEKTAYALELSATDPACALGTQPAMSMKVPHGKSIAVDAGLQLVTLLSAPCRDVQPPVTFVTAAHRGVGRLNAARSTPPSAQYSGQNGVKSLDDALALPFVSNPHQRPIEAALTALARGSHQHGHPLYIGFETEEELHFVFEFDQPLNADVTFLVPTLNAPRSWVLAPESVCVQVNDNPREKDLVLTRTDETPLVHDDRFVSQYSGRLQPAEGVRTLTFHVKPARLPPGHFGAGRPAWVFLSELMILDAPGKAQ